MKLLLTGQPGSGKTTLLEEFVANVPHKIGFVAREVRKNGERTGFELLDSTGRTATLASVDSPSEIRVSRYGVEVVSLDGFLDGLSPLTPHSLVYVDEIGQMQLFSEKFRRLILEYLGSSNLYIGTISSVFHDDFTKAVLARSDIVLLEITPENRKAIRDALEGLASNSNALQALSPIIQTKLTQIAQKYVRTGALIQLRKLFKNAVKYVAEGRVEKLSSQEFKVAGNTRDHRVIRQGSEMVCDCDLFKGAGAYVGKAGECSHIQSVKIVMA